MWTNEESCNGWPNWETKTVAVELANEESRVRTIVSYVRWCKRYGKTVTYDRYLEYAGWGRGADAAFNSSGVKMSDRRISRISMRRLFLELAGISD